MSGNLDSSSLEAFSAAGRLISAKASWVAPCLANEYAVAFPIPISLSAYSCLTVVLLTGRSAGDETCASQ